MYSTSRRACAGRYGWLHQLVRQTGAVGGASRSDKLEMSSATVFTKCLSMNRFSDQGKVACNPDCQIDFLFIHDQEIESRAFRTKASPLDINRFDQLTGNEHHNTLKQCIPNHWVNSLGSCYDLDTENERLLPDAGCVDSLLSATAFDYNY